MSAPREPEEFPPLTKIEKEVTPIDSLILQLEPTITNSEGVRITKDEEHKEMRFHLKKIGLRSCGKIPCWQDKIALETIIERLNLKTGITYIDSSAHLSIIYQLKESYDNIEKDKILTDIKNLTKVHDYFNFYIKRIELQINYFVDHLLPLNRG